MARDNSLQLLTTDELPTKAGSIVAERYRVDRLLGSGPMSVVVAATHLDIDRGVAIKFLNPDGADKYDAAERFRREAQTAAKLKNEHVVRVLDVGALPNGLPFMVMDLVEGRNLKDELSARGPFSVSEAAGYVLQAIEALAEAHAAGIVHRDLKPANLFLADRPDRSQIVKVLDFGVSKSLGESSGGGRLGLTRTGMVVGSPLYMPPEQLQSPKTVDYRADIWALGVVLYELVTGRLPYDTASLPELCTMLLTEPPAPISRYRRDISSEFESVILRCLEREKEHRYQNVSELANALMPFALPELHVHADRARRTLDRVTNPASSGVKVAFIASAEASGVKPLASKRARFSRVRMLAAVSLALGALVGLGAAHFDSSGRASPQKEPSLHLAAAPIPTIEAAKPQAMEVTPLEPAPETAPSSSAVSTRRSPPRGFVPRLSPAAPPATSAAPSGGYQLPNFGGRK